MLSDLPSEVAEEAGVVAPFREVPLLHGHVEAHGHHVHPPVLPGPVVGHIPAHPKPVVEVVFQGLHRPLLEQPGVGVVAAGRLPPLEGRCPEAVPLELPDDGLHPPVPGPKGRVHHLVHGVAEDGREGPVHVGQKAGADDLDTVGLGEVEHVNRDRVGGERGAQVLLYRGNDVVGREPFFDLADALLHPRRVGAPVVVLKAPVDEEVQDAQQVGAHPLEKLPAVVRVVRALPESPLQLGRVLGCLPQLGKGGRLRGRVQQAEVSRNDAFVLLLYLPSQALQRLHHLRSGLEALNDLAVLWLVVLQVVGVPGEGIEQAEEVVFQGALQVPVRLAVKRIRLLVLREGSQRCQEHAGQ